MVVTINTNQSALIALRNLNATNRDLDQVQKRISTGLRVTGAEDDAGIFSVAQNLRADVRGYDSVSQSVARGINIVDIAIAAATAISDLIIDLKKTAINAADPSISDSQRTLYDQDYQAMIDQLINMVNSAAFDGFNLINQTATNLLVLSEPSASTTTSITVDAVNFLTELERTGSGGKLGNVSTLSAATTEVNQLNLTLDFVNSRLSELGGSSKHLSSHSEFILKIQDALTIGIGNLVDADLGKESARLQSLQIKQELGTQALAIANQAPNSILQLFRNS